MQTNCLNFNDFLKKCFYIFGIIFLAVLNSCKPEKEKLPEEYNWLYQQKNIKDSSYNEKYTQSFTKYVKNKDYLSAAAIIKAKGRVLDYHLQYDSLYLAQCEKFINQYADKLDEKRNIWVRYFIGSQYDFNGKVKKSKKWLLSCDKAHISNQPNKTLGFAYKILSSTYKIESKLDSAKYYALAALKTFEALKDTANISGIHYDLFRVSSSLNDKVAASQSLEKMIALAKVSKDTLFLCTGYVAYVYLLGSSTTAPIKARLLSDSLNTIINQWQHPIEYMLFSNHHIKSIIAIQDSNLSKAAVELEACKKIQAQSNNLDYEFKINELEIMLGAKRNSAVPKKKFDLVLERALKNRDYYRAIQLMQIDIRSKDKKGDYLAAFRMLNKKIQYRDSLWNKDLKGKIYEFEKKYETVKKEKKILEQKQEIGERNNWIAVLSGGLLLGLLAFVFYNNQKKRKAIEKEKVLQEEYTNQLLQNTEEERERIAGDLHDSVNHKLLQLTNKVKKGDAVDESELKGIMEKIRSISHNLHPAMFEQVGLELSIKDLCQNVMENSFLQISTQIDYEKQLSTKQELQVYRIVQEAINNILKHSKATHAFIKILSNESELEVRIKDNGQGFDIDDLNDKKSTFGIANMQQRAKAIQGKVNLWSDESGTQINLSITT